MRELEAQNLMEWSRTIVEKLLAPDREKGGHYQVSFTIDPNPFDYDGIDECIIEIYKLTHREDWLESHIHYNKEKLVSISDFSVSKCVGQIEDWVNKTMKPKLLRKKLTQFVKEHLK